VSGSAQQGFTLLEMLVALAIFSLAALALVRLQGVSVRTAADLDQRTIAQIVVRNLAYERMTDPLPPAEGETSGTTENAGRTWRWTQAARSTMNGRLMGITIRVEGGPGQSPAVLSFTKAMPAEAAAR
jgi:general secretion pathway protein I